MKKDLIVKISIYIVLLSSFLFSKSLSSTEIQKMVAKIKKERVGIGLAKLEGTGNPFPIRIVEKKEPIVEKIVEDIVEMIPEEVHILKAIFNNKVFINKKWYKRGDSVGTYKVGAISSDSVVLESATAKRILSLNKTKKNFIQLNRGHK